MKRLSGAKGKVFRAELQIKSRWLSAAILILPLLLPQLAVGRNSAMIDQKETARHLTSHLEALTKKIGERSLERPENLKKTQAYIAAFYQNLGVPYTLQTYRYGQLEVANIVAEIPLGDRPVRRYLLGAHYDSVAGTVGADDNASAVAVQLETARELKKLGDKIRPDVSVCLVSFALEEPPVYGTDFMGSRVYARKARKGKEQIDGMLCLEMVGYTCRRPGCQAYPFPLTFFDYPETGDFIGIVGNFKSRTLTRDLAKSFVKRPGLPVVRLTVPFSGWILPAVRLSDHAAFWDQGYKAVMLTDSAFYRNPHYHLASDRMETLDVAFMAELVDGLIGFLAGQSNLKWACPGLSFWPKPLPWTAGLRLRAGLLTSLKRSLLCTAVTGGSDAYQHSRRRKSDSRKNGADGRPFSLTEDVSMAIETKEELLERILSSEKPHCPHCGKEMEIWEVPPVPCGDGLGWGTPYLYLCYNDDCPLYVRGWGDIEKNYGHKSSYRCLCYPGTENFECLPVFSSQGGRGQLVDEQLVAEQEILKEAIKKGFSILAGCYTDKDWLTVLNLLVDATQPARVRVKAAEMLGDLGELDAVEPIRNLKFGNDLLQQEVDKTINRIHERYFTRECPFCAEIIKKRAKVCKHCGKDVAGH